MEYIIAIMLGYFIGTINPAYLYGKSKGINIKTQGTKNAGASNATIVLGWRVGVGVALFDVLKSVIAISLIRYLYPGSVSLGYLTGIAVILGHIFPFYLRFNGGKGFASYMGMILALNWKVFVIILLIAIAVTVLTDYIALATLTTAFVYPAWYYYQEVNLTMTMHLLLLTLIIVYKHRENLIRIINGTEVGLRKVGKS